MRVDDLVVQDAVGRDEPARVAELAPAIVERLAAHVGQPPAGLDEDRLRPERVPQLGMARRVYVQIAHAPAMSPSLSPTEPTLSSSEMPSSARTRSMVSLRCDFDATMRISEATRTSLDVQPLGARRRRRIDEGAAAARRVIELVADRLIDHAERRRAPRRGARSSR